MWKYTVQHFAALESNISVPSERLTELGARSVRIGECFARKYYNGAFDPTHIRIVGSFGKGTATKWTSDVDLMCQLPLSEMDRYSAYSANGQSALLNDVKEMLAETYSRSELRGDGQVVVIDFEDIKYEVVPAFVMSNGQIYIADSNNGGRWKSTNPDQEEQWIRELDARCPKLVAPLIKYLKIWKLNCDVPLKSFILERTAIIFIRDWGSVESINNPTFWHDFMLRDYFEFLNSIDHLVLPHGEIVHFGDGWKRKAEAALTAVRSACYFEHADLPQAAAEAWRSVFGPAFPPHVYSLAA